MTSGKFTRPSRILFGQVTKESTVTGEKAKYEGLLARPNGDFPPDSPVLGHAAIDFPPGSKDFPPGPKNEFIFIPNSEYGEQLQEYQAKLATWKEQRASRERVGLDLLLRHYGIEKAPDQFLQLSLALARDHVPYFQPARRTGRPKSAFTLMLPFIAELYGTRTTSAPEFCKMFAGAYNLSWQGVQRDIKAELARRKKGSGKKKK